MRGTLSWLLVLFVALHMIYFLKLIFNPVVNRTNCPSSTHVSTTTSSLDWASDHHLVWHSLSALTPSEVCLFYENQLTNRQWSLYTELHQSFHVSRAYGLAFSVVDLYVVCCYVFMAELASYSFAKNWDLTHLHLLITTIVILEFTELVL